MFHSFAKFETRPLQNFRMYWKYCVKIVSKNLQNTCSYSNFNWIYDYGMQGLIENSIISLNIVGSGLDPLVQRCTTLMLWRAKKMVIGIFLGEINYVGTQLLWCFNKKASQIHRHQFQLWGPNWKLSRATYDPRAVCCACLSKGAQLKSHGGPQFFDSSMLS